MVSGAEIVSQELDVLNQEYTDLVNTMLHRLNELKTLISSQEDQKVSSTKTFLGGLFVASYDNKITKYLKYTIKVQNARDILKRMNPFSD